MKILLITDGWYPQMSGVVRTFSSIIKELNKKGHSTEVIHPNLFPTIPCPTYPEIRLAIWPGRRISLAIREYKPDAIHIVIEGPLGLAARHYCRRKKIPFTSSYTTKFPEYIHARFHIPEHITYNLLRWFHAPSSALMVSTTTLKNDLDNRGFKNTVLWTRGVDVELFRPRSKAFIKDPRPISMYVGRVAIEKNIEAFLNLNVPGTKYVVGGGPQLEELMVKYPEVVFVGMKYGEELAMYYASADVFVFPSLTDTFGLVMLEALASGVPIAAYPVTGPLDLFRESDVGVLDEDLSRAVGEALSITPQKCRDFALGYSWEHVTDMFLSYLAQIPER